MIVRNVENPEVPAGKCHSLTNTRDENIFAVVVAA